nr:hybrid signal transduction histidine kinase k [Quercus suber]
MPEDMDHSPVSQVPVNGIGANKDAALGLPAELRTLLHFFNLDDRPSALLAQNLISCLYKNEAFEHLELDQEELDRLFDTHGHRWRSDQESRSHIDIFENGRIWRSTALPEHGLCSLVCLQSTAQDDTRKLLNLRIKGFGTSQHQQQLGSNDNASEIERPIAHVDWTRHSVPGLSPWIEHIRTFDWSSTHIGPMDQWSDILRSYVFFMMMNPIPRILVWGEQYTFLYNEAALNLIGAKHPSSLGQPLQESWAEIWSVIGPLIEGAYSGVTSPQERMPLAITRTPGFLEETYWTFCLVPVMDADGKVVGCLDELQELTHLVTGDRRRIGVLNISECLPRASSLKELWQVFLDSLHDMVEDVPYALIYSTVKGSFVGDLDDEDLPHTSPCICALEGVLGIQRGDVDSYAQFTSTYHPDKYMDITQAVARAWNTGEQIVLRTEDGTLPEPFSEPVSDRGFGDPIRTALVAPILYVNGEVLGVFVIGLNPRSPFDREYSIFINITIDLLTRAASLISLPEEQRQAQKLATNLNNALAQQLQLTTLEAERSEAKFSRMAAASPVGMFVFDPHGSPLYVNDKYLEIIGETREQHEKHTASASSWADTVHEDDIDRFINSWGVIFESQAPISVEYRLKRLSENGMECWLLANAFPEFGPDSKITTVMGWLIDVSHNKYSEKLAYQRLEDALENKRQTENFLDMTSHEMRNPLSAILQSADWIVSTLEAERENLPPGITEELVDAADTVILCAQHQKRIVDDILTLSKLDASLLVISPDRVKLPLLISKALKMYEAEILRARITASLCIEASYTDLDIDCVLLDSSRLLQNSGTREITIYLGASLERPKGKHHNVDFIPPRQSSLPLQPPAEDDIYLQVAVKDSGQGLTDEEMKVLFQRFSQGSAKTYKAYGGSGLGLFISRELCELQGGQIGVSSGAGQTSFTFYVKAKRCTSDDDTMSNTSAAFTAGSVYSISSRRGSLIPVEERRTLSISAMPSASNGPENEESEIIPLAVPLQAPIETVVAMHVLIVEDNILLRNALVKQCYLAENGLEAISFLETSVFCAAEQPLSVILLDLEMPTMDGLTCIRHIRAMQADGRISGHVPVIAVTANARPEQISIALEAGMDQVITKPFRIPDLIPQMEALIQDIHLRCGT